MKMDLCDCVTGFLFSEAGLPPATMCDSGVSLTSCTEDAGLDTSDCDSPTGKGGHTVTIQVSNSLQKHDKPFGSIRKGNVRQDLSFQVKVEATVQIFCEVLGIQVWVKYVRGRGRSSWIIWPDSCS